MNVYDYVIGGKVKRVIKSKMFIIHSLVMYIII